MTNPSLTDTYGPVIYAYTRAQALDDGEQIDVTTQAAAAGLRYPTFLTRAVFERQVAFPPDVPGQIMVSRITAIVWNLSKVLLYIRPGTNRASFALYIPIDAKSRRLIRLVAVCGPHDIDDPHPAITIMLPDED